MNTSNALLVQMMFVVLLTSGIVRIVTALAGLVDRRTGIKLDRLHTGWAILLLLVYFDQFWHALDVWMVQEWSFLKFLYIVSGAIIIFFATNVLLPNASIPDASDLRAQYFRIARSFFLFFGMLQLWAIGSDFVLGRGFTGAGGFNAANFALSMLLMSTRLENVHRLGVVAGALLFVSALLSRELGVIA
jgi:hypothetical protein